MSDRSLPPVLLISVDGMRPDAIDLADTPCMHALIRDGAYCRSARTVMPSVTLPCHTSMFRGVDVPRHGITTNVFQPLARPVPSVFDVAKENDLTTGMFYNWAELRDLMAPQSTSVSYLYNNAFSTEGDDIVADMAVRHLAESQFDLVFLYLGYTDECGHEHGWMSEKYLEAVSNADRCIGRVLDAYRSRPNVLLLSDHGGHGKTHGTEQDEDMTIPFLLNGPSVRAGVELREEVRIFDACPTIAALAGLPLHRYWHGRVVTEALV
jgi:predicted AlkP superfamily pyrophosphatase or phosphodiesterase